MVWLLVPDSSVVPRFNHLIIIFIDLIVIIIISSYSFLITTPALPSIPNMWLRGRANVLLSEGRWFDSSGLHVEVPLGKILNPKTASDVMWRTGLHLAWQPVLSVYESMYELL